MQVDCYKRNYRSSVCTMKCRFYRECTREYGKEMVRFAKGRQRQGHSACVSCIRDDYFIGTKLED
nr:MAG TPA: hypothetical protein [Caudoviricetes sp.]